MKAIVIRQFGPPEVMRLEDYPTPEPGPGELVLKVHAVTVNRTLDLAVRAGSYAVPIKLPHIPGVDPAGVVVAIGAGIGDRRVGERVVALPWRPTPGAPLVFLGVQHPGGYAEYVKLPASAAVPIPDGVDFATAAVVARHAPMAFALLRDRAAVQPGEWVLVMGAAGGLGAAGVQVAKQLGARVIAGAGAPARVQAALDLGADLGIDYRRTDLTAEVMRITGGAGVNVVFENIADPVLFPKAFATLARGGRLVTTGSHGGGKVELDVTRLYLNQISVLGGGAGYQFKDVEVSLRAAAAGTFKAIIDRKLPLGAAAEAQRLVAERAGIGKVVLEPTRIA